MKFSLKYVVVANDGREYEAVIEQTIFDGCMVQSVARKWAWDLISKQRWQHVSKWVFEMDGVAQAIPEWGVKFVHGACPTGFAVEDGGVEEWTFWLTKPFTPFTVEEINLIEREWSSSEDNQWVLKDSGMPTGGVLMDGLPTGTPVIELSVYLADILPYSR